MRLKATALILILALLPLGLPGQSANPPVTIKVDAGHPGAAISPQMFGIFFEDINFGADGGLYPELVKNRSFEFSEPLTGWHEVLGLQRQRPRSSQGRARRPHRRPAERAQSALSQRVARLRTGLRLLQRRLSRHGRPRAEPSIASPPTCAAEWAQKPPRRHHRRQTGKTSAPASSKASTTTGRNMRPSSAPTATADKAQLESLRR